MSKLYSQAEVRHPVNQCRGKKQFDKKEAKRKLRRTESMYPGEKFEAYRCPHCDWWHLGHRPWRAS